MLLKTSEPLVLLGQSCFSDQKHLVSSHWIDGKHRTWCLDFRETGWHNPVCWQTKSSLKWEINTALPVQLQGSRSAWLLTAADQSNPRIPEKYVHGKTLSYTKAEWDDVSAVHFVSIYRRQCRFMCAYVCVSVRYLQTLQYKWFVVVCGRNRACWVL